MSPWSTPDLPVGDQPVDRRSRCVQLEVHLGELVLHHRVEGVGPAWDRDRALRGGRLDRQLECPLGDAEIHVRHQWERPDIHRDEEGMLLVAGRNDSADPLVGNEGTVEDGVVALGGPHAEGVPIRHDGDAVAVALDEAVDDDGPIRFGGIEGVNAEIRPDGPVRSEHLATRESVAAGNALG
jgi:hypothetical protein